LTPPVAGALLRAAFVASCFRGALPPVDLRAVCFVRAILMSFYLSYSNYEFYKFLRLWYQTIKSLLSIRYKVKLIKNLLKFSKTTNQNKNSYLKKIYLIHD
jgi:hypothetical protein